MADLKRFRVLVTKYRKPWTQGELAEAIDLTANDLSHRLGGTGHSALTQKNILDIVVTLAEWQALSWAQAVELLRLMDYPLDTLQWKTRLQEHLSPPDLALSPTQKGTPSAFVPDAPEEKQSGRRRLFQARDLPKSYVPRPKAFDAIKHLLLNRQDGQTTAITTALRGAGGFGKTTLALALCHDPEIQAAFPDGILWVELGEQPPRPLDVLNGVLHALELSLSGAITLEEARDRWRSALQGRVCLLVVDDVWQAVALEPLLEDGPQCVRLVTTRNDQVLPEDAARVWVDAMEPAEAIAVLGRGLPDEVQQAAYQPRLKELAQRLGYWPLLLTLAHGMLTSFVKHGQNIAKALTNIEKAYQTRGVRAFQQDNADERQQTADACLEVSLRHLKKMTPIHYDATTRYHELAVFPEDTDIPLTTLQTYWQGTGGLEDWETEYLCICLDDLSLLLPTDLGISTIRLHDVLRNYLTQRAGPHLPTLHARLLDAYQQIFGVTRWAELPRSEEYLWQHLILHLCQAGRREVLQTTLTDLSYLIRKTLYVGVSALETDFLLASTVFPTEAADPAPSFFASLHRNIVRISHLLRQTQTEAEIGGILLSYFGWDAAFVGQRLLLERELPRPFLTAWHPLPDESSSALRRTLQSHRTIISDCAVSPDSRFIVSASLDHTLKIWETATGQERFTLTGHTDGVNGCAVSPDGRFIISASSDGTLKIWETATGQERFTLTGHTNRVNGCAVSPDSRFIVSASLDHTLKVWDAATGAERFTLTGHTDGVNGCAVSPDSRFIVSASLDHTLKVWDAATGAEHLTLSGHTDSVSGCAVSPDGRFIVSGSADFTLKVWDAVTGAERRTLQDHTLCVDGCAVSPDGRFIVSASWDGTLKVWDAVTSAERLSFIGHISEVRGCAVSPDGRFIISASGGKTLKVWDAATREERRTLSGHTDNVKGFAVSPDGTWVVSASFDRTLKVWDAATGAERRTLRGHTNSVEGCAVSPDGTWIVSASLDGTLKIWDAATGAERLSLVGHTFWATNCAVSPDGTWIVSASNDQTLKVWDAVTGAERLTLIGHTGGVSGCTVSLDGRFIVSASSDKTLKVWDAQTGQGLLTFPVNGFLHSCVFYPDGEHLVACGLQGMYFLRLVM